MELPRIIIVATDFSDQADRAIRAAVHLASALQARCIIAHAYSAPILDLRDGTVRTADNRLLQGEIEAKSKLEKMRTTYGSLLASLEWRAVRGDPREAILHLADAEQADLLVVGMRGRGGAARLILGSVAEFLVRHSKTAVLTVPAARSGVG